MMQVDFYRRLDTSFRNNICDGQIDASGDVLRRIFTRLEDDD